MAKMHRRLAIFGIVLLIIGLFCVFVRERQLYIDYLGPWEHPYRIVGIVLSVTGIVLTTLGFVLPKMSWGAS